MNNVQVRSWEEAEIHVAVLQEQIRQLEMRVRTAEKLLDTFVETVWWKRWVFIIDGWSGHRLVDKPKWRPWRKWWRS
jgi:hypothetical protein